MSDNTDRISHLPSEIIEKILNLLPCRDAVSTSILSSDWRYKWISMTDLNFGDDGCGTEYKHAKFITKFLLRHRGPIRKFAVQFNSPWMEELIEPLMQLASMHDIEELQVVFEKRPYPRFPSCLFNCKKLTHLEMSISRMNNIPPTFEGFLNLKSLKLSIEMVDTTTSSIESLISKSPLLESLNLYVLYSKVISVTISAPKMKYLSLKGDFDRICLEKSDALVDMSLVLFGVERDFDLFKILIGAPNIEKLALQYFKRFKVGCYRGVLSTKFSYLKVMNLFEFDFEESKAIPLVLELLTCAPNLEKLVIYNKRCCFQQIVKVNYHFWEKEYLVGHCFKKLKVVEMSYIACLAPELELVKFILLNSPVLEKMLIGTDQMKRGIITRMLMKLPTLPCDSTQVEVAFHGEYSGWRPKCSLES